MPVPDFLALAPASERRRREARPGYKPSGQRSGPAVLGIKLSTGTVSFRGGLESHDLPLVRSGGTPTPEVCRSASASGGPAQADDSSRVPDGHIWHMPLAIGPTDRPTTCDCEAPM